MSVHPATTAELSELTWFAGSGRDVEATLADAQDVLCNWALLGVHPAAGGFRIYVLERSCDAVACIDGDGKTFGVVSSPTGPAEWAEFLSRHDIRV